MTEILAQALRYAELGYFVYPVNLSIDERGKKVVEFPGNWRDSTRDKNQLHDLFVPGINGIALDTGKSGICVIDVDVSNSKAGLSNLREAGIALPHSSSRVQTWSGGFHGYFRQPQNPVGSGSNRPVRDVDYRGLGGVIFAPPTRVLGIDGGIIGEYVATAPIVAVGDLEPLPESYASRLRAKPAERKPGAATRLPTIGVREDQARVIQQYMDSDLEVIRMAGPGERNEALKRTTFLLADRCLKLGYGYDDYMDLVVDAYEASGGTDKTQVTDWVKSSWKNVQESPLDMPRTFIDEMADKKHAQMVANRLANARLIGATSQMIGASSFVDWSVPPPPPPYWVHGVIPQGEQVVLYGRPEAGKTFLALDWAMSIATGRRTWGRQTTQGRVWFCAGEGQARITSRMHAWMQYTGITPDPKWLKLINHVPDLMNDQVIEAMAQKIAEDEVDLVIIDTVGRAMAVGGGDISETKDAAQALRSLQALSKYRPSTTPLAIHHPIKEGGMAGAYNFLGGLDVVLKAESDDGYGTLKFAKNKDGEKTKICEYQWRPVGPSAVLVPMYGDDNG